VIGEQPMHITFENSQYQQALEMRKEGVNIPDTTVVRYSNLAEKYDIMKDMQPKPSDPTVEAKAKLLEAQARETDAKRTSKAVETQYSAIQTAQVIATTPATSPLADALLLSAGYQDQNAAPIIPNAPAGLPAVAMPANTNPLTPANPAVGMNQGIETPAADGVIA
jgi:hypothetical protein